MKSAIGTHFDHRDPDARQSFQLPRSRAPRPLARERAPQEFISAAKYGYLFQGHITTGSVKPRGTPSWGLQGENFVNFLENHDQVDNSAYGIRGQHLTSPGRWRAMTALLLLMPGTPMLFHMFLEGEKEGLYHTADATLWFFHAINRYLVYSGRPSDVSALVSRR